MGVRAPLRPGGLRPVPGLRWAPAVGRRVMGRSSWPAPGLRRALVPGLRPSPSCSRCPRWSSLRCRRAGARAASPRSCGRCLAGVCSKRVRFRVSLGDAAVSGDFLPFHYDARRLASRPRCTSGGVSTRPSRVLKRPLSGLGGLYSRAFSAQTGPPEGVPLRMVGAKGTVAPYGLPELRALPARPPASVASVVHGRSCPLTGPARPTRDVGWGGPTAGLSGYAPYRPPATRTSPSAASVSRTATTAGRRTPVNAATTSSTPTGASAPATVRWTTCA